MENSPSSDVERIARSITMELAPEEEPLFASAVQRFREAPDRPPTVGTRDHPLAFGLDIGLALSPFALWLTQEALTFAAQLVAPSVARASKPLLSRMRHMLSRWPVIGRFFRPRVGPAAVPAQALTPQQLARVHEACVSRAEAAGVEAEAAQQLADGIVSRLARQA
jgi:hypothetical protein